MRLLGQFTFSTSPAMVALSVAFVLAVALCSAITWRRSGYRTALGLQELLRVGIVAVAALLLNQPEQIDTAISDAKPTVVVLVDESASMTTRDVADEQSSTAESRAAVAESLLRDGIWDAIRQQARLVVETFGTDAQDQGQTNLERPLAQIAQKYPLARAALLISDGDWTTGRPPVEGADKLRQARIPVSTVPLGSPQRLPDIELVSLDAPTFAVVGKPVQIPFTIDSSLPEEERREVVLEASDGSVVRQEVRVEPMGRTSATILWQPETTGRLTLMLKVPVSSNELRADNNEASAKIAVREEKLRVLIVESYPRWEYRYLRNALLRDPGVDVSSLLFHPHLDKVGGGGADYLAAFPDQREQLAPYDVVFLGDVGVRSNQLTTRQCDLLQGLIEQQASGLVLLPGRQGRQQSLLETSLADLYPVVLDPTQPAGSGAGSASHFQLTAAGRQSLLTRLAETPQENQDVWESLPGFQWMAPVVRARAGSEVLAVHASESNQYGRLPLIVTRNAGSGRVLLMATDGAWRWRMGVEDKYHYRFWGQVVRWMAYQRNMAEGETMRLYYTPDQPRVGRTLSLDANVMTETGEPLANTGHVAARIIAPSGKVETIRLRSSGQAWGAFAGQFIPAEPGEHAVTLISRETGAQLQTTIYARGRVQEQPGRAARPEVLAEIAQVSGGEVLSPADISRFADVLAETLDRPAIVRRIQWGRRPEVVFALVGLLGLFWSWRKALGLT